MFKKAALLSAVAIVAVATPALARDQIRIVGSSTVYPFATAVAEEFGKTSGFATPVIESTGSGGGLKLFCAGVGTQHPDITNASRRIKKSEIEECAKNGVTEITDPMLYAAAVACVDAMTEEEFASGRTFPAIDRIREVSHLVAVRVIEVALREGLTTKIKPAQVAGREGALEELVAKKMYDPIYVPLVDPSK